MNKTEFLNIVENKIEEHHLLNHSFYKAWNAGELDRSTIKNMLLNILNMFLLSLDIYHQFTRTAIV